MRTFPTIDLILNFVLLTSTTTLAFQQQTKYLHRTSTSTSSCLSMSAATDSLVVVSPPGGVGEVTAVRAASIGKSVKWFVVSPPAGVTVGGGADTGVDLSPETLAEIAMAGGQLDFAGADAQSLLLPKDDPNSAVSAVSSWASSADIVCTVDGIDSTKIKSTDPDVSGFEIAQKWMNAVKVAAKEASSSSSSGRKIAILSADEEAYLDADEDGEGNNDGPGLLGSLFGGNNQVAVPFSLAEALGADGTTVLRHGELFGMPESSPNFSPLIGGPRRDAQICEEYTMRSVRVEPTMANTMGSSSRTSRQSLGEAAALLLAGQVDGAGAAESLDVCLTSQRGVDAVPVEIWDEEFQRCIKSSKENAGGVIFQTTFSAVPDVERLADWLNTKWAPAVLRTYDIAAIRVGARPVYASRPLNSDSNNGQVEIVWQKLVDFESVTVGKMIVQVSDDGLTATRGAGDPNKGYGRVSRKPLAGEEVLVRRLAEAAAQAIEKGLAKKAMAPKKKPEKVIVKEAPVVSSIQTSGTVTATAAPAPATATTSESGPRQAGVRRSKERTRGSRQRKRTTPPPPSTPKADE